MLRARQLGLGLALLLLSVAAKADLNVGVVLSLSGPAASVGRAQAAVIDALPEQIGGHTVRYVLRDDASQPAGAARQAVALVEQVKVDLVIGTSTVAASRAMLAELAPRGVALISTAAIDLQGAGSDARWGFRTLPDRTLLAAGLAAHMRGHGLHRVAFIGLAGGFGERWWADFGTLAQVRGLTLVDDQRFGADDTDLSAWAGRIHALAPDAVMVAAAGSAALVPVHALRAAGFEGPIYQTHAVALEAFVHACASDCERVRIAATPARLSPGPSAGPGAAAFHARLGDRGAPFVAALWDAGQLAARALASAGAVAEPGSTAYRQAVRDGLEAVRGLEGGNGVYDLSPGDHLGLDQRSVVIVRRQRDAWVRAD